MQPNMEYRLLFLVKCHTSVINTLMTVSNQRSFRVLGVVYDMVIAISGIWPCGWMATEVDTLLTLQGMMSFKGNKYFSAYCKNDFLNLNI